MILGFQSISVLQLMILGFQSILRRRTKEVEYSFVSFIATLEHEINCLFYALNRFTQFTISTAATINFLTLRLIIVHSQQAQDNVNKAGHVKYKGRSTTTMCHG